METLSGVDNSWFVHGPVVVDVLVLFFLSVFVSSGLRILVVVVLLLSVKSGFRILVLLTCGCP